MISDSQVGLRASRTLSERIGFEGRSEKEFSALPQLLGSRFQTVGQYLEDFLKQKNLENQVLPQYLERPNI